MENLFEHEEYLELERKFRVGLPEDVTDRDSYRNLIGCVYKFGLKDGQTQVSL
jgi:hypothetical protein